MSIKNTGKIELIGMIKHMEQKYAKQTNQYFYMLDIQPVNGYVTRVQAWGDAVDYIVTNEIKCGDIIWVHGYYHTYEMTPKNQTSPKSYVTFKTEDIKRPGGRFECDVTLNEWNVDVVDGIDGVIYFTATPQVECFNDGKWLNAKDILCGISVNNKAISECSLIPGQKYHLVGSIDNRNKTQFKTIVDSILPLEQNTPVVDNTYHTMNNEQLKDTLFKAKDLSKECELDFKIRHDDSNIEKSIYKWDLLDGTFSKVD